MEKKRAGEECEEAGEGWGGAGEVKRYNLVIFMTTSNSHLLNLKQDKSKKS